MIHLSFPTRLKQKLASLFAATWSMSGLWELRAWETVRTN